MAYQHPRFEPNGARGEQPRPLLPVRLANTLREGVRAVLGAGLLGITAITWLALVSWSLHDPSLSHPTALHARNWLGSPGAMGADLILQTLGLAALAVVLAPMFWGLTLVQREPVARLAHRFISYLTAIPALAAAASALPSPASWPLYHGLGGIIGDAAFRVASAPFALAHAEYGRPVAGLVCLAVGLWSAAHSIGATWASLQRVPRTRRTKPTTKPITKRATANVASQSEVRAEPVLTLPVQRATPVTARPPDPRTQIQYGPYAGFDTDADEPIDPEFDAWTEQASSGIASRFAPQAMTPATGTPRGLQEAVLDVFTGGRAAVRNAPAGDEQPQDVLPAAPLSATTARTQAKTQAYKRPSLNLLERAAGPATTTAVAASLLRGNARLLEDTLADFGVIGQVRDITPGPVVTRFELEPARGTNLARVMALADDIARGMGTQSVRITPVPGMLTLGIEMPNLVRVQIALRDVFDTETYRATTDMLPIALGLTITGEPVVADLAQLPSLLVSGANGSGKSTGINAMILSLLYKHGPDECRFLMIDEKMLDLAVYNGIPHLLTPVVSDPHKALTALAWCVSEMEERAKRMATLGVRNIDLFNNRVRNAKKRGERLARTVQTGFDDRTGEATYVKEDMNLEPMPYIVIVIDEFAGLMAVAGREIEGAVARLAQAARSCGIHLIMATERPSNDIVTGAIKTSVPARVSYKSANRSDSRAVLDAEGAEQLLGSGDMLFTNGAGLPLRVHGPYVSQAEIESVTGTLRQQGAPRYVEGLAGSAGVERSVTVRTGAVTGTARTSAVMTAQSADALYDRAVAIIARDARASRDHLARRLNITPGWAEALLQRLHADGVIGPPDAHGQCQVLVGVAA